MKWRVYTMMAMVQGVGVPGKPSRLVCVARTKGEARGLFKERLGRLPGQRLNAKVRVRPGVDPRQLADTN